MRKFHLLLFFLFLISFQFPVQAYNVEEVPDPKDHNGYVSDPDNKLSLEDKAVLEEMLTQLETRSTSQFAVVVLDSIGETIAKDFASRLFNYWGIGKAKKDNGLLMLVVVGQHRVEIETGYGMEPILPDLLCKRIEENLMVPSFKQGNYGEGIIKGVDAICKEIYDPKNAKQIEDRSVPTVSQMAKQMFKVVLFFILMVYYGFLIFAFFLKYKNKTFTHLHAKDEGPNKTNVPISIFGWIILYGVLPVVLYMAYLNDPNISQFFLSIYVLIGFWLFEKRLRTNRFVTKAQTDTHDKYTALTSSHSNYWFIAVIFFPVPYLFYLFFYNKRKTKLRDLPRECKSCHTAMIKLGEKEDDKFLNKPQLIEEKINSIDYDVWICNSCSYQEALAYVNQSSNYTQCSDCSARTNYIKSDVTIYAATYDSKGKGRKTYACKNCEYSAFLEYDIPRLTRSSSSSSYSGSSSSSGSSWGGGSSGGGGAGSSW